MGAPGLGGKKNITKVGSMVAWRNGALRPLLLPLPCHLMALQWPRRAHAPLPTQTLTLIPF